MKLHYKPWHTIAMDFITDLPLSNGCDSILVILDPYTKMGHFVSLQQDGKKANDLIRIFAREHWRLHGMPLDIISDRDSRFTAHIWKDLLKHLGVKPRMNTAFHPKTNGQKERLNTLEIYLRAFVNYEMSNWEDLLPTAEFAYNNSTTIPLEMTPSTRTTATIQLLTTLLSGTPEPRQQGCSSIHQTSTVDQYIDPPFHQLQSTGASIM